MPVVNFTGRALEKLMAKRNSPELGQVDYFDRDNPGFGLRVSANYEDENGQLRPGKRAWFVMYRFNGRKRRLTIGSGMIKYADAKEIAASILAQAAKGEVDPADERRQRREAQTVGELATQYIDEYARPNKRSWKKDRQLIDYNVRPHLGRIKADRLTSKQVRGMIREVQNRGAPIPATRSFEVLRRMYNWAIQEEIVECSNPCAGIEKPAKSGERSETLSLSELRAYWQHLNAPRDRVIDQIAVGVLKGMLLMNQRRNEVHHMRWCDLDLETGWWNIPADLVKTGAKTKTGYRLPITPAMRAVIDEMRALKIDSEWVFPGRGGNNPISERSILDVFDEIRTVLGRPEYRPHDTLHTVTTFMSSDEVGIGLRDEEIDRIRHHVAGKGQITRYNHHKYDGEKRRSLTKWENWLLEQVGERSADTNVVELSA